MHVLPSKAPVLIPNFHSKPIHSLRGTIWDLSVILALIGNTWEKVWVFPSEQQQCFDRMHVYDPVMLTKRKPVWVVFVQT